MTWTSSTTQTRLAKPSHEEWIPSAGQSQAVQFCLSKRRCAVWADPGAGKTSIVLEAFSRLPTAGRKPRMLVVCTKRILQLTWRQEAARWTQFKHFKFAVLHGDKKDKALLADADIYLITYDGLAWLSKKWKGEWPFDVVVVDESTKIKNHTASRSRNLRAHTKQTPFKWELTGTPNPNGYEDLFGQMLWIDERILDTAKTRFYDMYFKRGFSGFGWELQTGADARIEARVAPYVFRLPYTDLPPTTLDIRQIKLEPEARKIYRDMKANELMTFGEHTVSGVNAGSLQSKLEQMANGAVYDDLKQGYVLIHNQKLDALEDLIEEMSGQPLFVAYQFRHDLARIQERFAKQFASGRFATFDGATEKRAMQLQDDWNAGKIEVLFAHPASVGHGLNLQRGGACHVCWFSATFDYEHWEQFNRRLWRQGNPADRIVIHILAVIGTIDDLKLVAVDGKGMTQAQLLQAVHELMSNDLLENETMSTAPIQRLGTQGGQPAAPQAGGWGAPPPQPTQNAAPPPQQAPQGGWGAPPAAPQPDQRQVIEQRVAAPQGNWAPPPAPAQQQVYAEPPPAGSGMSHFSQETQQQVYAEPQPAADPSYGQTVVDPPSAPKTRTRAPKAQGSGETQVVAAEQASETRSGAVFVEVKFHGDPAAVKAAMRAFLAA